MLDAAYDSYRAQLRQLVIDLNVAAHGRSRVPSPKLCMAPWPPSLGDDKPTTCQLPRGHHSRHYHLPRGATTAAVEWT